MTAEQPELNEKQKEAILLQEENKKLIQKLAMHGAQVGNLMETRHEKFIEFLVELGVMTQDQLDDFNVTWEQHVNDTLSDGMEKILQQIRMHQIASGMGPNGGQQPGPSGLIIPGH